MERLDLALVQRLRNEVDERRARAARLSAEGKAHGCEAKSRAGAMAQVLEDLGVLRGLEAAQERVMATQIERLLDGKRLADTHVSDIGRAS